MNSAVLLADTGNIGLLACAAIDTTAVLSYGWRNRGGTHGKWWRTAVGIHLMAFMAAFAIILDENAVFLLTTHQVLVAVAPFRPDWFAWLRTVSFVALIPPVLGWRLALILRPPRLHPPLDGQGSQRQAEAEPCGRGSFPASEPGLRGERDGSTQEGYSRSVDPDHPGILSLALILRPPR